MERPSNQPPEPPMASALDEGSDGYPPGVVPYVATMVVSIILAFGGLASAVFMARAESPGEMLQWGCLTALCILVAVLLDSHRRSL